MRKLNVIKQLFLKVRDLPFEVIPGTSLNYQKAIQSIRKYKKGSCTSKHFYLGKLYKEMGLNVYYVTYIFYWEEQEYLNDELRKLARDLPEQYHLTLRINGKLIDATFDKFLAPLFPVNEFDDCGVSVRYVDEIQHLSPKERIRYVKIRVRKSHKLQNFYRGLNEYTKKIRSRYLLF